MPPWIFARRLLMMGASPWQPLIADGHFPLLDIDFVNNRAYDRGEYKLSTDVVTVTRASTKLVDDVDGNFTSISSNVLARSNRGALIEQAETTPLVLWNTAPTVANGWTHENITCAQNGETAPDGTTAYRMDAGSSGSSFSRILHIPAASFTSGQSYHVEWYVKPINNTTYVHIFGFSAAFGFQAYQNFDLSGSGALGVAGTSVTNAGIKKYNNGWFRIWVDMPASGTASSKVALGFSSAIDAGRNPTTTGGDRLIDVWAPQITTSSLLLSPVLTTSSGSRSADAPKLASLSGLTALPLTIFAEFEVPNLNSAIAWRVVDLYPGSANVVNIRNSSGSVYAAMAADGAVTGASIVANETVSVAARFAANDLRLAVNGVLSALDTSATDPGSFTEISLGNTVISSPRQLNGYLKRITFFNAAIQDGALV